LSLHSHHQLINHHLNCLFLSPFIHSTLFWFNSTTPSTTSFTSTVQQFTRIPLIPKTLLNHFQSTTTFLKQHRKSSTTKNTSPVTSTSHHLANTSLKPYPSNNYKHYIIHKALLHILTAITSILHHNHSPSTTLFLHRHQLTYLHLLYNSYTAQPS